MGDNGKALACQWGQGEDTAYGGQFLSGMTTHDTSTAESLEAMAPV